MPFGRKKKVVEKVEPTVDLEIPAVEVAKVEPVIQPIIEPVVEAVPEIAPAVQAIAEPVKVKPFAQVIHGELIENGLIRYTLIANKSIGVIGEIIPLDD